MVYRVKIEGFFFLFFSLRQVFTGYWDFVDYLRVFFFFSLLGFFFFFCFSSTGQKRRSARGSVINAWHNANEKKFEKFFFFSSFFFSLGSREKYRTRKLSAAGGRGVHSLLRRV